MLAGRSPAHEKIIMSVTDYVIDLLLIAVIFRQVRPHRLTPRSALLPLVLMAAGIIYLRSFTLGGDDLALIIILAVAGIVPSPARPCSLPPHPMRARTTAM